MDSIKLFKKATDIVSTIFSLYITAGINYGNDKDPSGYPFILFESLESGFNHMVTSVLTVFIVIDLFKAFVDYHENDRIKLTDITDATILIVLREVAVGLYSKEFGYEFILSLAALLLVLGIIRVLAVKYSPARTQGPYTAIQDEGQYSKKDTGVTLDLFKAASERN